MAMDICLPLLKHWHSYVYYESICDICSSNDDDDDDETLLELFGKIFVDTKIKQLY